MGYQELLLNLPPEYSADELYHKIAKKFGIEQFSYQIVAKSLDARHKNNIFWLLKVAVFSKQLKGKMLSTKKLEVPFQKRKQKILIIGSGPAGFFAAYILQKAGFQTTILEKGKDITNRVVSIQKFEQTGNFDPIANYVYGEGGAGTFSDGKLTARNKHYSLEKQFILDTYIQAGAPEEINYLVYPHLGSDNLRKIVFNLRRRYQDLGGQIIFEKELDDLEIKNNKVFSGNCKNEIFTADFFIIAPGHSAKHTYQMLLNKGIKFKAKKFAIGARVEHSQALINKAQWGSEEIKGLGSAEYRLTFSADGFLPIYTFCMCPGGMVVPATPDNNKNIVNGMSFYARKGKYANAACVAAIDLDNLLKKNVSAQEALQWLDDLELSFYNHDKKFQIPACSIKDFINNTASSNLMASSYPFDLYSASLWEMFPSEVSISIREGLKNFCKKIKGFEEGQIMGLESKTSAPIQVLRDEYLNCADIENLFVVGEGSGHSGGIISSAIDGLKVALNLINI